ncbi:hypothetical protein GOODEAATRI_028860 [Goodea atripinnis]|uniref:Uncharacterized protein n=1 Tax=Goodea atripinnis TaxID=208336 RepID=A0ABV0N607_9TELE
MFPNLDTDYTSLGEHPYLTDGKCSGLRGCYTPEHIKTVIGLERYRRGLIAHPEAIIVPDAWKGPDITLTYGTYVKPCGVPLCYLCGSDPGKHQPDCHMNMKVLKQSLRKALSNFNKCPLPAHLIPASCAALSCISPCQHRLSVDRLSSMAVPNRAFGYLLATLLALGAFAEGEDLIPAEASRSGTVGSWLDDLTAKIRTSQITIEPAMLASQTMSDNTPLDPHHSLFPPVISSGTKHMFCVLFRALCCLCNNRQSLTGLHLNTDMDNSNEEATLRARRTLCNSRSQTQTPSNRCVRPSDPL